jgi:hypothetical protein
MKNIVDLFAGINIADKITKQAGLDFFTSTIPKWMSPIHGNLHLVGLQNSLSKSAGYPSIHFAANEWITKSMGFPQKLSIPQTAFSLINQIAERQTHMGNLFKSIPFLATSPYASTQLNYLNSSLYNVAERIIATSAYHKQWELFAEFERINAQAIEIALTLEESPNLTESDMEAFKALIASVIQFFRQNKKISGYSLVFLTIVTSMMSIHQYWDFIKSKPEGLTKEDLKQLRWDIIEQVHNELKERKEYRITNRVCKVMLKPSFRSTILDTLPVDFEVVALQVNHKWIYINYIDIEDNLPQTGWVLKKYTKAP